MKIAIDVRTLYVFKNRGLGAAQMCLLEGLRRNRDGNEYTLLIDEFNYANNTEDLIRTYHPDFAGVIADPRFTMKVVPEFGNSIGSYDYTWEQVRLGRKFTLPEGSLFVGYGFLAPVLRDYPTALYIPDAFIKVLPTFFDTEGKRIHKWVDLCITHSDMIMTCSENSKNDITKYYGVPAHRIRVVYDCIDDIFTPMSRQEARTALRDYYLPERFLLAVGVVEPRKNLAVAVRALKSYRDRTGRELALVIAGSTALGADGRLYTEVADEIRRQGLQKEVHLLGYVSDEVLTRLYSASEALIFPSLYEGFGRPPIEAMASGVPAICADASCVGEITAGAARLFDPKDHESAADALVEVLENPATRDELVAKGFEVAKRYTYENRTRLVLDALGELAR